MGSYWGGVAPQTSSTGVLVRRGKFGDRDTQGERRVTTEAATGVSLLPAKECQGLMVATRSCKRPGRIYPESQKDRGPADTLTVNFQPCNCEKINLCCFTPPRLWYSLTGPLGREDIGLCCTCRVRMTQWTPPAGWRAFTGPHFGPL